MRRPLRSLPDRGSHSGGGRTALVQLAASTPQRPGDLVLRSSKIRTAERSTPENVEADPRRPARRELELARGPIFSSELFFVFFFGRSATVEALEQWLARRAVATAPPRRGEGTCGGVQGGGEGARPAAPGARPRNEGGGCARACRTRARPSSTRSCCRRIRRSVPRHGRFRVIAAGRCRTAGSSTKLRRRRWDDLDAGITHVGPRQRPPLTPRQARLLAIEGLGGSAPSTRTCRSCTGPDAKGERKLSKGAHGGGIRARVAARNRRLAARGRCAKLPALLGWGPFGRRLTPCRRRGKLSRALQLEAREFRTPGPVDETTKA